MYSPQLHQEIARHRQADMLREARHERLAAIAAAAKPNGPGRLARVGGLLSSVASPWRGRVAARQPAVDSVA